MSLSELYCILLLAVLGIATAITVAATLHSLYREEPPAHIAFLKDRRRQVVKVSSNEMETLRAILARELKDHRKKPADPVTPAAPSAEVE
jgi:hypothetical protein